MRHAPPPSNKDHLAAPANKTAVAHVCVRGETKCGRQVRQHAAVNLRTAILRSSAYEEDTLLVSRRKPAVVPHESEQGSLRHADKAFDKVQQHNV